MIRQKHLISCVMLLFLVTGCQIFPDIYPNPTRTPDDLWVKTTTPAATTSVNPITRTPEKTATVTPITQKTRTPTEPIILTAVPFPVFVPQEGNPVYLTNFNHPDAGCGWIGVAGQVFDESGHELKDLTVLLGNTRDGERNQLAAITGLATAYGPGGYEINFLDRTFESSALYWVQVYKRGGHPVSERVFFDTYDNCEKNLILINFVTRETTSNP